MLKRKVSLFVIIILAGTMLNAQVTTSDIRGSVKSTTNEPLVGASILATHQPSGTKYSTISNKNGEFSISNMRAGGPYLIEIRFVGFDKEKIDEVYLKLAETFIINSTLEKTVGTLENVVVTTGRRNPILNSGRTGAVTNINRSQIEKMPSISRSINDLTRATPQANGSSIAGGNYRQNNFTIDGSDFNNTFGIGTNLPAGGSPISLDAIDEISVNISPFDIRQSGFIGSAINAVTRSGTNTYAGSVYNYFRNERQRGNQVENIKFVRPLEQYKLEGVRISGPIIKNKLFFFFNYEKEAQPKTIQTRVASTPGAAFGSSPQIARPTADSLKYISDYLSKTYGYETGAFDNYSTDIKRKKIMGRIDWNINQNHHFSARYSQVE
ncbi:MAG: carboxypeptidase regulatory-like domain-containing protein, partial [Bacteroidota bacterium]